MNLGIRFGGGLNEKGSFDLFHEIESLLGFHLLLEVAFGAYQKKKSIFAALLVEICQPLSQVVETGLVVNGIDQEDC